MEQELWNLEDKWKLSTEKAIALFACTSFLVVCTCIVGMRLSRRRGSVHQEPPRAEPLAPVAAWAEPPLEPPRRWVVKVLMGSVRWSGRRCKWELMSLRGSGREGSPTPLLVKRDVVGGQSSNSTSAVWQRPILMGEKCELPRFSGLILYDQRGLPLHQFQQEAMHMQENAGPIVRTTLRDLL